MKLKKLNANIRTLYDIMGMFTKHHKEFDMLGKSKKNSQNELTIIIDMLNRQTQLQNINK